MNFSLLALKMIHQCWFWKLLWNQWKGNYFLKIITWIINTFHGFQIFINVIFKKAFIIRENAKKAWRLSRSHCFCKLCFQGYSGFLIVLIELSHNSLRSFLFTLHNLMHQHLMHFFKLILNFIRFFKTQLARLHFQTHYLSWIQIQ